MKNIYSITTTRRKRKHGFQLPLSIPQVFAAICYLLTTITHYILILIFYIGISKYICLGISVVCTFIVMLFWYLVSTTNPEMIGNEIPSSLICGRKQPRSTRYCPECRKTIFEIDHHCSFLNTCIGTKNYLSFIGLIVMTSCQSIFHMLICIFLITISYHEDIIDNNMHSEIIGFYIILGIQSLISFAMAMGSLILLGFHIYLYFIAQVGTYDWVLLRRQGKFQELSRYRLESRSNSNGSIQQQSTNYERTTDSRKFELKRQAMREEYEQKLLEARNHRNQGNTNTNHHPPGTDTGVHKPKHNHPGHLSSHYGIQSQHSSNLLSIPSHSHDYDSLDDIEHQLYTTTTTINHHHSHHSHNSTHNNSHNNSHTNKQLLPLYHRTSSHNLSSSSLHHSFHSVLSYHSHHSHHSNTSIHDEQETNTIGMNGLGGGGEGRGGREGGKGMPLDNIQHISSSTVASSSHDQPSPNPHTTSSTTTTTATTSIPSQNDLIDTRIDMINRLKPLPHTTLPSVATGIVLIPVPTITTTATTATTAAVTTIGSNINRLVLMKTAPSVTIYPLDDDS